MPYVEQNRRVVLTPVSEETAQTAGELNFQITRLFIDYLDYHGVSYQNVHDAIGAAQDAADELKRRVLNQYEDKKIAENGDVYPASWPVAKKVWDKLDPGAVIEAHAGAIIYDDPASRIP